MSPEILTGKSPEMLSYVAPNFIMFNNILTSLARLFRFINEMYYNWLAFELALIIIIIFFDPLQSPSH